MKKFVFALLVISCAFGKPYTSDEWKIPQPNKPDLTVTFIERLPRYPGYRCTYKEIENDPELGTGDLLPESYINPELKRWPAKGDNITFIAHVKNAGTKKTKPFDWFWTIDGKEVDSGITSQGLNPNNEMVFTNKWIWNSGNHYVAFDVERRGLEDEITRNNNTVVDQINGLSFHFFVEQGLVDWFKTVRNGMNSYCWEDWAKIQVQEMNRTFRDEIHPSTPEGIKLRVRLDRIFIVTNGMCDPEGMHTPAIKLPANFNEPELLSWENKTNDGFGETYANCSAGCDGVWGFTTGYLITNETGSNVYERLSNWILGPEWALFHELGHQLGLPDYYLTPVNKNDNHVLKGVDYNPSTVFKSQMMHSGNYAHDDAIGRGQGRWDCNYRFWSEGAANALSKYRTKRRGMFGWYISDAPKSNQFNFIKEDGTPLGDAAITFYRCRAKGYSNPEIPDTPVYIGKTDKNGNWTMPGPPNKRYMNWGNNTSHFFTISKGGNIYYAWINFNDINLEYYRGKKIGKYNLIAKKY